MAPEPARGLQYPQILEVSESMIFWYQLTRVVPYKVVVAVV